MNAFLSRPPAAPYPGLRPFQPHESSIFFGRAGQIDGMLARLETQRFLAVVGASGSGKSSLVRAGLLPALADGFLMGAPGDWHFVIARPGIAPYANLATAFCGEIVASDRDPTPFERSFAESQLRSGRRGLVELLRKNNVPDDRHVLVLIDQFEELFRFRHADQASDDRAPQDKHQQRNAAIAFVDLLLSTARQTERSVFVVITMRSDFMGDCDAFFGLPEAISDSQFLTPRMTRDQLADAITGPLDQFQATIEPDVVNLIANEVGSDPDQLPLMQHALWRMWEFACADAGVEPNQVGRSRDGDPLALTVEHYNLAGRVEGALNLHPQEIYIRLGEEMGEPGQRIAQRLFRCLAERSPQGQLVRRLTTIGEVAAMADAPVSTVAEVVAAFSGVGCHFLVTSPAGDMTKSTTVDISHESLLRQWKQLRQWVTDEADAVDELRKLLDDAKRWERRKKGLLQQPELGVFQRWRDERVPSTEWAMRYVSADEFALADRYLQSSRVEEQRLKDEAEAESQRKLDEQRQRAEEAVAVADRQRRQKRISLAAAAVAGVMFLLAFGAAYQAWKATGKAEQATKDAQKARNEAIDSLVQAVLVAPPEAVPFAVGFLDENKDQTVGQLRENFSNPKSQRQKLNAAFALAHLGDVREDFLIDSIATGPTGQCGNIVRALRDVRSSALDKIPQRLEDDKSTSEQRARLATVALHLKDTATARELLALKEDPTDRTAFIHGYHRWRGDLMDLANLLDEVKTDPTLADVRSAVCAALGFIPWDSLDTKEQEVLQATLEDLCTESQDGGTHSAAACTLTKWAQVVPKQQGSNRPAEGQGWFVNGQGMTMIDISDGEFWMGDDDSPAVNEKPRHKVELTQSFFLSNREVTVAQFQAFIEDVRSDPKHPATEYVKDWEMDRPETSPDAECPVQNVNWYQAVLFCNWLSASEDLKPCYPAAESESGQEDRWECDFGASGYRLPTEAEWEYACRARSQGDFCFGDDENLLREYGYFFDNSDDRTWPAGYKLPNGWGLFDLHGSVWEWCNDYYESPYSLPAPPDPRGPDEGSGRVYRGGSWFIRAEGCRSAYRGWIRPGDRVNYLGFRVLRSSVRSVKPRPSQQVSGAGNGG